MSDLELLRKYREERSDDAFALLVERHLDMVYSAALRQLRSTQLAEEVAQAVFSDLAQNCSRLKTETVLAAWLHEVTRRTAIDLIRKEARRQHREKIAILMSEPNQNSPEWSKIEPFLDEALSRLNPKDRAAVLLRFFDDKPFREIGETLRISEDAAQKRVDRAIERLGKLLGAPGIRVGTASLAGCLSVHAVHAAPGGLGFVICSVCSTSAGAACSTATFSLLKGITMTTVQKSCVAAALALAVGTSLYESAQASRLAREAQKQGAAARALKQHVDELVTGRDEAISKMSMLRDENARLRQDASELSKLRAEVTRLRAADVGGVKSAAEEANPQMDAAAKAWLNRAARLHAALDRMPDKGIPELKLIDESVWLDATKNANFDTDEGARKALNELRDRAKELFIKKLRAALTDYTNQNDSMLPSDLSLLKPYFDVPIDDAILQRYALVRQGKLSDPNETIVREVGPPVDEEYDTVHEIGLTSGVTGPNSQMIESVLTAAIEFSQANSGQVPQQPSEIAEYLKKPVPEDKVREYLKDLRPADLIKAVEIMGTRR